MNYISYTQYKQVPLSVQNTLLAWYKLNAKVGDFVTHPSGDATPYVLTDMAYLQELLHDTTSKAIPLLSTHQLFQFIMDTTNKGIDTITFDGACWTIKLKHIKTNKDTSLAGVHNVCFCGPRLLQILWQCASSVALDPYYNQSYQIKNQRGA